MPAFLTAEDKEDELANAEGHSNMFGELQSIWIVQLFHKVPVLNDHVFHEVLVIRENCHIRILKVMLLEKE